MDYRWKEQSFERTATTISYDVRRVLRSGRSAAAAGFKRFETVDLTQRFTRQAEGRQARRTDSTLPTDDAAQGSPASPGFVTFRSIPAPRPHRTDAARVGDTRGWRTDTARQARG